MSEDDYYFEELAEAVNELEKGTAQYGIAQKVLYEGFDGLSPKQRYVYENYVAPYVDEIFEENKRNQILNMATD